jgi:TldD protein
MEDLLDFAVDTVGRLNVEYAEVRYQSDYNESVILKNGVTEATIVDDVSGINIRVLVDGSLGFASTNIPTKGSVKKAIDQAFRFACVTSKIPGNPISMSEGKLCRGKMEEIPTINFMDIDIESRIQLLIDVDKQALDTALKNKVKMPNRFIKLDTWYTKKRIITSDGVDISSKIPKVALYTLLTAYHPQEGSVQRRFILGGTGGWEIVKNWFLPELFMKESQILSSILLKAKRRPKEKTDLILGPEVIGLVCHESSGHPSEADRILGREAAQAGETYLKMDSNGLRVGSLQVNVIDDPTLKGSFGYYIYDEEGIQARKRFLIKEGEINEFLHNRETAKVFNVESNGSSRAVAYNREPIIRMANTFLEPGDYNDEELFEGVSKGVYIKNFMEWNIDDRRFNQRYVGLEAYRIEKGELKERIKNPVLELTTVGLWSSVDAVGKDLEFQAAYCGKGDPMQAMPVWIGGPKVRLRDVMLGGA